MTFTETEKTELQQKFNNSLPKEIVAFLNANGGTLYIGVKDDGTVCGVQNLDESLKKIADILENQILPDPRVFTELGTKFVDGKHVIEINVQKGDGLYYIKKYGRSSQGCFIRVGSTSRPMTEDQITAIHNKLLDSKVKITEIASRIENPSFQYLKLLLTEKGFTINETAFARNFHLLTQDGVCNKMAELLADKNEVSIKVVRFNGKTKGEGIALRNEYGEKCLIVAMKQAFDYCADVINGTRVSFTNGVRKNQELFDRDAFREAWFNACLHNNWADGTPPAVYIYTDRIEIISTGGLPSNLSKEDFFRGVSKPVNDELAKLFIRLDLMEQTGYGVPLVAEKYGKDVFEFLDFFLRVTLPFAYELKNNDTEDSSQESTKTTQKTAQDTTQNTTQKTAQDTTQNTTRKTTQKTAQDTTQNTTRKTTQKTTRKTTQKTAQKTTQKTAQKILSLIKENPHITRAELATQCKISENGIKWQLGQLKKRNIIHHIGADNGGHWAIVSAGNNDKNAKK